MAWLAADEDGEWLFKHKPKRAESGDWWYADAKAATGNMDCELAQLAHGEIKRMIGRTLTWEDEPVQI